MTGTITLSDQGQDYIFFDIENNIITAVRPSRTLGWIDTKILNRSFTIGSRLLIELHNGYRLALKYPIVSIQ
jgi:hypothetical protein